MLCGMVFKVGEWFKVLLKVGGLYKVGGLCGMVHNMGEGGGGGGGGRGGLWNGS